MIVLQATASVAAVWMLATLFGVRWAILAPLALYLISADDRPGDDVVDGRAEPGVPFSRRSSSPSAPP